MIFTVVILLASLAIRAAASVVEKKFTIDRYCLHIVKQPLM